MKLLLLLVLAPVAALAQTTVIGGGGSSVCVLSGSQTSGYVLTATDSGTGCDWEAVGGASVDATTAKNAQYCPDTSVSANTITCSTTTTFPTLAAGQLIRVKVANTNTGATTIAVSGGSSKNVTKFGTTALAAGNLVSGSAYLFVYDGTQWQVLAPKLLAADIPTLASTALSDSSSLVRTSDSGSVTNTMLAGSIANGKLANSSMTLAGHSVSLGGTQTLASTDLSDTTGLVRTTRTVNTHALSSDVALVPSDIDAACQAKGNSTGSKSIDWTAGYCASATLTGNVTYSFTDPAKPAHIRLLLTQDATGGRTITWPGNTVGLPQPDPTATLETVVAIYWDGSQYTIDGVVCPTCSYWTGATASAAGTPASGYVRYWNDSTGLTLQSKDSSGNVDSMVRTAGSGTSNSWVDYVATTGIPHVSQPGFSNLSGTATAAQLPKTASDGSTLGVVAMNGTDFTCTTGVCDTIQSIATGASPSFVSVTHSGTGASQMNSGTTAQRPGSPTNGLLRYNSTFGYVEAYQNSTWAPINGSYFWPANGTSASTNSASEANLKVITIPAAIMGANSCLELFTTWTMTGTAGTKTPIIRLSTTSGDTSGGTTYLSTASASANLALKNITQICNANSTSAQIGNNAPGIGFQSATNATSTINTANVWYININGLVANTGDSLAISSYTLRLVQ